MFSFLVFDSWSAIKSEVSSSDLQYVLSSYTAEIGDNNYRVSLRSIYTKYQSNLKPYLIEIFESMSLFSLEINPCPRGEHLCSETQENWLVEGDQDLFVRWEAERKLYECSTLYQVKQNCGTFLEIHQPLNTQILQSTKIEGSPNTPTFSNLHLYSLPSGRYDIWLVYNTRTGPVLKDVFTIFLISSENLRSLS